MEPMMTARQVAELLGVHENWVYDQAASGELPSYKIGGTRRFDRNEVNGWIADHREPEHRDEPRLRGTKKRAAPAANRRRAQGEKRQSKAVPPRNGGDPQPRLFE
jgi:excisionase family DNA binding protein